MMFPSQKKGHFHDDKSEEATNNRWPLAAGFQFPRAQQNAWYSPEN